MCEKIIKKMSNFALHRGTVICGPFCTLVHCDSHSVLYPTSDVYTDTFLSPCIVLVLSELQHTVNVFMYVFI